MVESIAQLEVVHPSGFAELDVAPAQILIHFVRSLSEVCVYSARNRSYEPIVEQLSALYRIRSDLRTTKTPFTQIIFTILMHFLS